LTALGSARENKPTGRFDTVSRHSATREHIVAAALRLVRLRGYHRTALGDVLRESGAAKGNFYHHFRSKEELGYAVIDRLARDMTERVLDPIFSDPARPPLAQVEAFLDAIVAAQRARSCVGGCPVGNLAVELADEHEGFRARLTAILEQWRTRLAEALRRARSEGALAPEADPDRVARFLLAALEGAILLGKVHRDAGVLEGCIAELRAHLARGAPRAPVAPGEAPDGEGGP